MAEWHRFNGEDDSARGVVDTTYPVGASYDKLAPGTDVFEASALPAGTGITLSAVLRTVGGAIASLALVDLAAPGVAVIELVGTGSATGELIESAVSAALTAGHTYAIKLKTSDGAKVANAWGIVLSTAQLPAVAPSATVDGLSLVTAPVGYPITLARAKRHLKIGTAVTEDDDDIEDDLIPAVVERCELATGRQLMTATWDYVFDTFPCESYLEMPRAPLQSVTWVKYRDTAGVLQTWAATNYAVGTPTGSRCSPGRITLAYSAIWPTTYGTAGDVQIRFVAGYGAASDVPQLLKAAMLLDLGTLYNAREGVALSRDPAVEIPMGVKSIYWGFKAIRIQPLRVA